MNSVSQCLRIAGKTDRGPYGGIEKVAWIGVVEKDRGYVALTQMGGRLKPVRAGISISVSQITESVGIIRSICLLADWARGISQAPGTLGTLAAVPLYLLMQPLSDALYLLIVVFLFVVGIWLCDRIPQDLGCTIMRGLSGTVGWAAGYVWLASQRLAG